MGDVLMTGAGGGGVTSDDVTATRDKVVQGVTALTSDSDDEPIEGAIIDRGGELEATTGTKTSNSILLDILEGWYHKSDGKPKIRFLFKKLISLLGIDFNKVLTTQEIAGKTGTIIPRGFGQQDTSEFGINSGKAYARFEPGYYSSLDGVNKPWVWIPFANLKSTLGIDKTKMLDTLTVANEQGTIPSHPNGETTYESRYDGNINKLWARLPRRNGYYSNPGNDPWLYIEREQIVSALNLDASKWLSNYNIMGINGHIPEWTIPHNHGDVITTWNNEHTIFDDIYPSNRGRLYLLRIPNNHVIRGANWVARHEPHLFPENIREGAHIGGIWGTMKDYSIGRVVFNGTNFDGVLMTELVDKLAAVLYNNATSAHMGGGSVPEALNDYSAIQYVAPLSWNIKLGVRGLYANCLFGLWAKHSIDLTPFSKIRMETVLAPKPHKNNYWGVTIRVVPVSAVLTVNTIPHFLKVQSNGATIQVQKFFSEGPWRTDRSLYVTASHENPNVELNVSGLSGHYHLLIAVNPSSSSSGTNNYVSNAARVTKIEFVN